MKNLFVKSEEQNKEISNRSRVVLLVIGLLLLLEFYAFRGDQEFMQLIIDKVSAPIRRLLSGINSYFAFSVGELIYMVGIPLMAVTLSISTIRYFLRKLPGKRFAAVLLTAAIVVTYVGCGFSWLWSVSYYGDDVLDKTGMELRDITLSELAETAYYFAEHANALSTEVARDGEGNFAESEDEIFAAATSVYENIEKEERWSFLEQPARVPKRLKFSKIATAMGYSGFYFPLTAEANINMDAPAAFRPVIIAHETAHQRLAASEAETNFVGILASVSSGNTAYEYSGYLMGLMYLAKALKDTDAESWEALAATYTPEVSADLAANSAYWAENQSLFHTISRKIYGSFLQSNGQQKLSITYNACIYYLVMYYEDYVFEWE